MQVRHGRLVSHAEVGDFLRRFGYSPEQVRDLLRELPDPVDLYRCTKVLAKHGITIPNLAERMGGSP